MKYYFITDEVSTLNVDTMDASGSLSHIKQMILGYRYNLKFEVRINAGVKSEFQFLRLKGENQIQIKYIGKKLSPSASGNAHDRYCLNSHVNPQPLPIDILDFQRGFVRSSIKVPRGLNRLLFGKRQSNKQIIIPFVIFLLSRRSVSMQTIQLISTYNQAGQL